MRIYKPRKTDFRALADMAHARALESLEDNMLPVTQRTINDLRAIRDMLQGVYHDVLDILTETDRIASLRGYDKELVSARDADVQIMVARDALSMALIDISKAIQSASEMREAHKKGIAAAKDKIKAEWPGGKDEK